MLICMSDIMQGAEQVNKAWSLPSKIFFEGIFTCNLCVFKTLQGRLDYAHFTGEERAMKHLTGDYTSGPFLVTLGF